MRGGRTAQFLFLRSQITAGFRLHRIGVVFTRSAMEGGYLPIRSPPKRTCEPPYLQYLSEGIAPPPIPVKRQNYRRRSEPRAPGARAASPGSFVILFVIKSKKLSLRVERTTAASPRPTCGSRPSWEQSVDDESSTYDEPAGAGERGPTMM